MRQEDRPDAKKGASSIAGCSFLCLSPGAFWPHSHFLASGIPSSERSLASFQNLPLRHSSLTNFLGPILIFLCQAFPSLSVPWPHSKISLSGIPPRHISLVSFSFSCVRHSSLTNSLGLKNKNSYQAKAQPTSLISSFESHHPPPFPLQLPFLSSLSPWTP